MGLSQTELKALRDYPARFDPIADQTPDSWNSKYGLWTQLHTEDCRGLCQEYEGPITYTNKDGQAGCLECGCSRYMVFSIVAEDAVSLREQVKDMRSCDCCGTWFQDPANT
jgi:hypothetical protein